MSHYNKDYFVWQKSMGLLGAKLNKFLFENFISKGDHLLDFGCGGGFLLNELSATQKLGIEINESGRNNAKELGVETVELISEVEDQWADVIISNHALEHVDQPLDVIKELFTKLKPNGKIIFVVPFERTNSYKANDINYHLYTWSPMNLGNLFHRAGFEVNEVKVVAHKWPPRFDQLVKLFGYKTFYIMSKIYGILNRNQTQVRIIATKNPSIS